MQAHPGMVFRSGPDWPLVLNATGEEAIRRTAELSDLTAEQVRSAIRYYAGYPDEIDEWMRRVDGEAARMEAAWSRQQALLRRS